MGLHYYQKYVMTTVDGSPLKIYERRNATGVITEEYLKHTIEGMLSLLNTVGENGKGKRDE
eukprot:1008356-Amphidinium_carterae.1